MRKDSMEPSRHIKTLGTFIATGLCLSVVLVSCQGPKEKVAAARVDVTEAKEQVADARQDLKEAKREMRVEWQEAWLKVKSENDKDIAENERTIIDLRRKVRDIDSRNRAKYTTHIDDMERSNYALRDRVNNVRDQGDVVWEQFKKDMKRDMDNLKVSLKNTTIINA